MNKWIFCCVNVYTDVVSETFKNGPGADRVQLCMCVLTGGRAVCQMNGDLGLNDFQISGNRWKGHTRTTQHSSIKASREWSSLLWTDTVNHLRLTLSWLTAWALKAWGWGERNTNLEGSILRQELELILLVSVLSFNPDWSASWEQGTDRKSVV